jgi:hypothetical protein
MATTDEIFLSAHYYLPYWVVQDHVGIPDSFFVRCTLVTLTSTMVEDDDGEILYLETCEVIVGDDRIGDIMRTYLIPRHKLVQWSKHFADWVCNSAKELEKCQLN